MNRTRVIPNLNALLYVLLLKDDYSSLSFLDEAPNLPTITGAIDKEVAIAENWMFIYGRSHGKQG